MTTIITRSALVFHGHDPAPDVASVVIDPIEGRRVVTWADVMRDRRERQALILDRKRHTNPWRPHRLWVAYFDQDFFGGWQAFIGDFRGRAGESWIDRDRRWLIPDLMRLFPLVLPLGRDQRERFDDWKQAFARAHRRGTHHRKPRGCTYVWWDGKGIPSLASTPGEAS